MVSILEGFHCSLIPTSRYFQIFRNPGGTEHVQAMCTRLFFLHPRTRAWENKASHLRVACRSICNQDQNQIKQSISFLRSDQEIKVTKIKGSMILRRHRYNCVLYTAINRGASLFYRTYRNRMEQFCHIIYKTEHVQIGVQSHTRLLNVTMCIEMH